VTIIEIALALAAAYSGGTYLHVYWLALRGEVEHQQAELNTFHLGLCFILALGFLGLLLK
jgi:hypothetical protein